MRFVPTVMIALALGLAAGGARADEARVTVTFAQPERYTDLRASCVSREADARALLDEMEVYAAPVTADHLRYEKALLRGWLRHELRGRSGS